MQFMRRVRSAVRALSASAPRWPASRRSVTPWLLTMALLTGCGAGAGSDSAEAADAPEAAPLEEDGAKAAYTMGYRFADNVRRQFPGELDGDAFVRGVTDRLADRDAAVDDAEAERVLTAMLEQRQAEAASEALQTLEEGLAFLEENGKRDGVVALESGLQYEVLEEGEGPKPAASDTVTTHYEGRLIDGTVFDSSYQRGEPASFPLNRVIPGWTEGLQLMSPGAKYRLFVPAELAYGERAAGSIPPNSTLIFDVELLKIGEPDAAPGDEAGAEDSAEAQ